MEKVGGDGQATDYILLRRMFIACWIPNAPNTHSEYIILIAFPRQQRLRERASILRHTYNACLAMSTSAERDADIGVLPVNKHF